MSGFSKTMFGGVLMLGLLQAAWSGEPPRVLPVHVSVDTVTESDDVEVKRYTGHASVISTVDLVARVSAELLKVGFVEGDFVKVDQVLYELDDTRYAAEVENIEAKIAELAAKKEYSNISHSRIKHLHDKAVTTTAELDKTVSERDAAHAAHRASEAQLRVVKDDLAHTKIRAPIAGKIGLTRYTAGNYLTPNSGVLATIVQHDPLRISFGMANRDYLSLFGGEEALRNRSSLRLHLADDSIYEFEGAVEFLDNQANKKTDAIQVFARFPNPKGKLVPGSTVTVMLSRKNGGRKAAIAPSAVMHDRESAYVYVLDADNKVERRDVVLGHSTSQSQLIREGLRVGERIVVDGMHKTQPGGKVEPEEPLVPVIFAQADME